MSHAEQVEAVVVEIPTPDVSQVPVADVGKVFSRVDAGPALSQEASASEPGSPAGRALSSDDLASLDAGGACYCRFVQCSGGRCRVVRKRLSRSACCAVGGRCVKSC